MRRVCEVLTGVVLVLLFGGSLQTQAGQIVFVSDRDGNLEIYTMDDDGSNQMNRSNDSAADLFPNFCPDGRIVFHSDRDIGGDFDVFIMDNDGTDVTNLTPLESGNDGFPDCSDAGITFISDRDGGAADLEVCTMDVDGQNQDCDLHVDGGETPSWLHRAGTSIVFRRSAAGPPLTYDIWKMDPDGTDEVQLTDLDNWDIGPDGSPDGLKIAFTRCSAFPPENCEVYRMRNDGTAVTQLTDNLGGGESATGGWRQGFGGGITFSNNGDGDSEIFIMKENGGEKTQLTDNDDNDFQPDWR